MRKRTWIALALLTLAFVVSVGVLRVYRVELIQVVVVNALIQKAPPSAEAEIRQTFSRAWRRARRERREPRYLRELFQISQRLERAQRVDEEQLNEILRSLDRSETAR